jgi:small-conductance mechanosensitive channel
MIQQWSDVLVGSFQRLGLGVAEFLPHLLVAIIIFLAGWVVGALLGRIVEKAIDSVKVDNALRSAGVETMLHRAGWKLHSGRFMGMLVEWFVIVAFLIASFDVLGLTQVNIFLQDVVLSYLPQVIVAVLILLVAGVVAGVMQRVVAGATTAAGLPSANFLGTVTKWAIWVFAVLVALSHLGIAAPFVQTLFTGIVVAVSVAVGLAFGLGGQESAARFLENVRREIAEHNHQ